MEAGRFAVGSDDDTPSVVSGVKQLHRKMCATIAIVIRASLERSSRIAEQVKKLIHVAGAVPCDEKSLRHSSV